MTIIQIKRVVALAAAGALLGACAQDNAPATAAPGTAADSAAPAAGSAAPVSAADLTGDPEQGKRYYIYCQACHTLNEGGMNKVGPNLYGIYGAEAAQVEGFVYSDALTGSGLVWDEATLDAWIARPAELVPGTTMVFAGITDPQQRADLVAYLRQLAAK